MSSPVEIGDRMSGIYDYDDGKSATALDDRLRDNYVRQQLIRQANDARARCPMRVQISLATRRSPPRRLILTSSTCQLSIVIFTLLVIVYSSTRSIIATDQVPSSSPPPSARIKLLSTERTTATDATFHNHYHHVDDKRPPTTTPINGSVPRGENFNSDPEQGAKMSPAPSSVRLPRTDIKINRTRRASGSIMSNSHRQRSSPSSSAVNVCDDCLAIPMVALVGNKQVNGFLLHPAPANLQRHQSMASSSATSLSSSHYAPPTTMGSHRDQQQSGNGINRARYAHNNNHDHNISHYGPEGAASQASLIGGQSAPSSSSSYGVPLSTHGAHYRDQPPTATYPRHSGSGDPMGNGHYQHQYHRQVAAYKQVVSSSPFEPKSDEKCPMTGPLTVCDQINSYPADAIVHRVAAAKRALHKAYFDIDSLFSDEGDGFTEPFGANSSSSGVDMAAMMPEHHQHHHHHHHHHHQSPEPNHHHDNMTVAFNPSARHEHHYASGPGYHQSAPVSPASTRAYRAHNQQTMMSDGGYTGGAHQQEQIEVNNQRMEFAQRARASPSPTQGSRGAASSGQQLEQPPAARPPSTSAVLNSGLQRRQQAKRSPSSSSSVASLSGQRTNIGAPNDFLERQTQASAGGSSGDFLYLVERRGLTIGGRQTNAKAAREHLEPNDDGRMEVGQIMDHHHHKRQQQYEDGLLSLIAADSAPPRSSVVKSEKAHKSRRAEPLRPSAAQPSATVTGSKPDTGASDSGTASGHILPSSGTTISAATNSRQAPTTEVVRNQQQQQAQTAISQANTGQATGASRQRLRNGMEPFRFVTGSNVTQEAGPLSTQVQPKLSDKTSTTADRSAAGQTAEDDDRPLSSSMRLQAGQQLRSARASDHKSEQFVQPSYSLPRIQQQPSRIWELPAKSFSSSSSSGAIKLSHKDEQRNSQSPAGPKPSIDRSKRQVAPLPPPIQVDRAPAARAPGRTTTTTTTTAAPTEDLADPERASSTSTEDGDQAPAPQPICRAKSIYISPKAAMNHKKQWKYVVNAPERDPRIKQIIRVDICEAPFEPCSGDVTLPLGFTSQCKQKYAKKKLLALDARSGLLEVDTFFIPSCCVCQLLPPASARFDLESPLSSTSSSSDDESTPTTTMADDNNDDGQSSPGSGTPETSASGDDSRAGGANTEAANSSGVIDDNGDNNNAGAGAGDNSNEGR